MTWKRDVLPRFLELPGCSGGLTRGKVKGHRPGSQELAKGMDAHTYLGRHDKMVSQPIGVLL
jgi:hypothetical protein